MNIKQEFLRLAGLEAATYVVEAEEKQAAEFAKNSPETTAVKSAVRKAVHYCEAEASKVRSPNLRRTYEKDAEDYDSILGLINTGHQSAARKAWARMDTAGRDVVFDITTDKAVRKLLADYFGTTLLRENDEGDADENDIAVDKDIEQLKKDVAQLKKDQAKDVADEGAEDANDTTVTAKIKKVEDSVKELEKAQDKDDEEEVDEAADRNVQHANANKLRKLYDKRAVLKNAIKEAMGRRSEGAVDDLDEELQDLEKEISALEKSLDEGTNITETADKSAELKSEEDKLKEMEKDLSSLMSAARTEKENDAVDDFRKEVAKQKRLVARLKNSTRLHRAAQESGVVESNVKESTEVKVVDFKDAVEDEKEEKEEKAKIPAEVTKALKGKIKELEDEIKYTSHLQGQEQQIINLNGAIRVMADILELMDKGCEYSMKKIGILLASLEGPQKVLVPKEVWKFMSFDYTNPMSKSNLMDKFREVKAHASKIKD